MYLELMSSVCTMEQYVMTYTQLLLVSSVCTMEEHVTRTIHRVTTTA